MSNKEPIKNEPVLEKEQESETLSVENISRDFEEKAESFLEKVLNEKRKSFAKLDRDADAWLRIKEKYRPDITKEDYAKDVRKEYKKIKDEYIKARKDNLEEKLKALEREDVSPEEKNKRRDEIIKEAAIQEAIDLYEEKLAATMREEPESLRDIVKKTEEEMISRYRKLPPKHKIKTSLVFMETAGFGDTDSADMDSVDWIGFEIDHESDVSSKDAPDKTKDHFGEDEDQKTQPEFAKLEFSHDDKGNITGIEWDGDLSNFDWRDLMDHSSIAKSEKFGISDVSKIEDLLKEAKTYEQAIKKFTEEGRSKREEFEWLRNVLDEKIETLESEYGEFLNMDKVRSAFDIERYPDLYYGNDEKKEEEDVVDISEGVNEEVRETEDPVDDLEAVKEEERDTEKTNDTLEEVNKEERDTEKTDDTLEEVKENEVVEDVDDTSVSKKKGKADFDLPKPGMIPGTVLSEEEGVINPFALELFSKDPKEEVEEVIEKEDEEITVDEPPLKVEREADIKESTSANHKSLSWVITENILRGENGDIFINLNKSERNRLINQIKNEIAKDPSKFGLKEFKDTEHVQSGEEPDLSSLRSDGVLVEMIKDAEQQSGGAVHGKGDEEDTMVFEPERKISEEKPDPDPGSFFDPEDKDDVIFFERENSLGDLKQEKEENSSEDLVKEESDLGKSPEALSFKKAPSETEEGDFESDQQEPELEVKSKDSEETESSVKEDVQTVEGIMERFNMMETPENAKVVESILDNIESTDLDKGVKEILVDLYFFNWNKEGVSNKKVELTLSALLGKSYDDAKEFFYGVGSIQKDESANVVVSFEKRGLVEKEKQKATVIFSPSGEVSLKMSDEGGVENVPLNNDSLEDIKRELYRFFAN